MKRFYAVATTISNRGTKCKLVAEQHFEFKPQGSHTSTTSADYYVDWFESKEGAEEFVKSQL